MKYTAISDVSKAVTELLKTEMVPDIIEKPEQIGLCSPDNKGDYQLGIHLYNVEQSEGMRISGRQSVALDYQKFPPAVLDLYYMITPYLKSDVKFLAEQEQILLGRVLQIINDHASLSVGGETIVLEMCNPDFEDKIRIWGGNGNYKTSVFMSARAVIVDSARGAKVARVTDIVFDTKEK